MPYQKYIWKKATSTWELVTYDAGIIAAGVFDAARIPNLTANKIVAGEEGHVLKVISGLATWAAAGSGANNYLVSVSGSGNGDVTFVRDGLADIVWDAAHTHTFASLTSKPTTLAGYGITDAASNTHTHTFASLTSKPTTLSGYGITDALTSTHPASAVTAQKITNWDTAYGWNDHAGLYRPVAWVPSWSDVTSKPSTFTPASHTHGNITDDGKIGSTTDQVITTTTGGLLTTSSRSGIDSRSTFPPSSHTHLWADITDKPSTFTPSAHTHGNITNDGAIGSTANLVVMTGADGVLGAKAAGTTSQYLRGDGSWVTPPNTTYSLMTSTVLGLGKLFSDTEQSVAANAVSAVASRTYGIQVNASGQLVVNVPWVDTNTTYSEISEAEIDSNSSSTARLITGRRFHYGLRNIQTASTTLNLGVGATASGNTKTINIGTGGVAGSNTLINLGNSLSTVTIAGNLIFSGTATSINTTSLQVSDYIIEIAKDNTVALTGYAGFVIPKYDGTNAGGIIIDNAGEFRIGDVSYVGNVITDVGSQPVLTRVEKGALADGDIFVWNSTNLNAEGKTLAELNIQPLDADLTAIAALAGTAGLLKKTAANTWTLDTSVYLTGNQTITLTGDITGSGTTSITTTIGDGKVTNDMLAGSIANAKLANSTISGISLGANLATLTIGSGLSGTSYNGSSAVTIAHSNIITAGNFGDTGATRTLAFGGTFVIPYVTYDINGHVVTKSNLTLTMPANPNTDTNWYPTAFAWTGGTTAGPTGSLTGTGMPAVSFAAIPAAGSSASGIVTTGAQSFGGEKTFDSNIKVTGNVQIASKYKMEYNATEDSLDFIYM